MPPRSLELVEQYQVTYMYLVPTMMSRDPPAARAGSDWAGTCPRCGPPTTWPPRAPPHVKQAWIDWLGPEVIVELYAGTEAQAVTVIDGARVAGAPRFGRPGRDWARCGCSVPTARSCRPARSARSGCARRTARRTYRYVGAAARARDGWESLGDMGWFDEDGYLYLSDRQADMILVGGANVYPAEVEAALDEHPAVLSSCVDRPARRGLRERRARHRGDPRRRRDRRRLRGPSCRPGWSATSCPGPSSAADEPLRDDAGKVRRSALREARLPCHGGGSLVELPAVLTGRRPGAGRGATRSWPIWLP